MNTKIISFPHVADPDSRRCLRNAGRESCRLEKLFIVTLDLAVLTGAILCFLLECRV